MIFIKIFSVHTKNKQNAAKRMGLIVLFLCINIFLYTFYKHFSQNHSTLFHFQRWCAVQVRDFAQAVGGVVSWQLTW